MKKKLVSAIMAATLCASMMAGCGNDSEGTSSPSTSSPDTSSPQASSPDSPTSQQPSSAEGSSAESSGAADDGQWHYTNVDKLENPNVTIALYWDAFNEDGTYNTKNYAYPIGQAIEAFEQKYGGTVTRKAVGWNKGANAIAESLETGDAIDLVFTEGNKRFPVDAINELYLPIDAYLDYNVCDKASADAFLYKGEHYVYTNSSITQPYLLFYNVTMFEEESLETPTELYNKGEWTYAKFLEYIAHFTRDTDGDGQIDQWGLEPSRVKRQNIGFANDAMQVYEVGNGELAANIDTKEMIQYYEFLTSYNAIPSVREGCDTDGNWLERRVCAMMSEANIAAWLPGGEGYEGSDKFDFVPLPTYDGRQATTPVWDNGFALSASATNPEGAAVLASMICQYAMDSSEETLATLCDEKQIERLEAITAKIIPQRREYEGVSAAAGEGEALDGTPAQTIIETYKGQLEGEVSAYNANLKK